MKYYFLILVEVFIDFYIEGEEIYIIEEGDKLIIVIVDRFRFVLIEEVRVIFEIIYDEWEMIVC